MLTTKHKRMREKNTHRVQTLTTNTRPQTLKNILKKENNETQTEERIEEGESGDRWLPLVRKKK